MEHSPDRAAVEALPGATQRLLRTVDAMPDDAWSGPSLLPGWTRAHVVAHLALNAEGLAGALHGLGGEPPVPMYASPQARDSDIEELAAAGPSELRSRLLGSSTRLHDVLLAVPSEAWPAELERTPGGRRFRVSAVPSMRWREVEVHHVDLGLDRRPADWPTDFATALLDAMARRSTGGPFRVHATDLDRVWHCGGGGAPADDPTGGSTTHGPTVCGTAADLGWWLTGRGDGSGLTTDSGDLPRIGAL